MYSGLSYFDLVSRPLIGRTTFNIFECYTLNVTQQGVPVGRELANTQTGDRTIVHDPTLKHPS